MSKGSDRRIENSAKVGANWPWPEKKLHGMMVPESMEPEVGLYPFSYDYEIDENNAWPFPTSI